MLCGRVLVVVILAASVASPVLAQNEIEEAGRAARQIVRDLEAWGPPSLPDPRGQEPGDHSRNLYEYMRRANLYVWDRLKLETLLERENAFLRSNGRRGLQPPTPGVLFTGDPQLHLALNECSPNELRTFLAYLRSFPDGPVGPPGYRMLRNESELDAYEDEVLATGRFEAELNMRQHWIEEVQARLGEIPSNHVDPMTETASGNVLAAIRAFRVRRTLAKALAKASYKIQPDITHRMDEPLETAGTNGFTGVLGGSGAGDGTKRQIVVPEEVTPLDPAADEEAEQQPGVVPEDDLGFSEEEAERLYREIQQSFHRTRMPVESYQEQPMELMDAIGSSSVLATDITDSITSKMDGSEPVPPIKLEASTSEPFDSFGRGELFDSFGGSSIEKKLEKKLEEKAGKAIRKKAKKTIEKVADRDQHRITGLLEDTKVGDTFHGLAEKHGTTTPQMMLANGFPPGADRTLPAGQGIAIPPRSSLGSATYAITHPDGGLSHWKAEGDTIESIAARYEVSTDEIRAANKGKTFDDYAWGDLIRLPMHAAPPRDSQLLPEEFFRRF